jgi:D-alanyl-D-alanine carboxypeptidase
MVMVRTAAIALVGLMGACRHPSRIEPEPPSGRRTGARETAEAPATSAPTSPMGSAVPQADASTTPVAVADPFGPATPIPRYACPTIQRGGSFRSFLAAADTKFAFVDGDDALALVNRSPTGALAPAYAPTDLVDLHTGKPRPASQCESGQCLRRDAAKAMDGLLAEMRAAKVPGYVASTFRGFGTQCWVFANWANKARGGFCEATEQSALPGHSQHQLGTTVDLFTEDWAAHGGVFRNGFGCSAGGQWLDENAWRYGFVVPYPIHPDDRKDGSRCEARRDRPVPLDPKTGYKNEPWHLRFVGVDEAARYHEAWLASGPGTPDEITLEQWLRAKRGLVGDAELPVCDGCQCGACATLAEDDATTPCKTESLRLDAQGRIASPAEPPHLLDAHATATPDGSLRIDATISAPAHTPTQPPVVGPDGPSYPAGATYMALTPYAGTPPRRYPDLPGAWRLAAEPLPATPGVRWPWRASLANGKLAVTWNRANVVLPAKSGVATVPIVVALPAGAHRVQVTLLRDGVEHDTHAVDLP